LAKKLKIIKNILAQVQHFFDDPEGKIDIPPVFKVDHWNRPQDFIVDKVS